MVAEHLNDEALALLRELVEGQREILARLGRPRAGGHDPVMVERLLRAIAASLNIGGAVYAFSTGELIEHARLPGNEELRAAIGTTSAKRLGKLLSACEGRPCGGLAVQRAEPVRRREGVLWRIAPSRF